jgi:hypothetical protein
MMIAKSAIRWPVTCPGLLTLSRTPCSSQSANPQTSTRVILDTRRGGDLIRDVARQADSNRRSLF